MADEKAPAGEISSLDREFLDTSIELILRGGEQAPEALARLFDAFRCEIESGLRGINQTHAALLTVVELSYLRSGMHAEAFRLYRLSLEGQLEVADEPGHLIGTAIERSTTRPRKNRAQAAPEV